MTSKTKELQQERNKIYNDFYNNILPKRLPVSLIIPTAVARDGGLDPVECAFDPGRLKTLAKELCEKVYNDNCPIGFGSMASRPVKVYQALQSQSFAMGKTGYMQHPEVKGMEENEYQDLIKDPYAFLLEKVIPRQYRELDPSNPSGMAVALMRAKNLLDSGMKEGMIFRNELVDEFGYYTGGPRGAKGFCAAPFDFIADQLRGFKSISLDIKRHREELKEACEAVLPLLFHWALPKNPQPEGFVGMPLHMPPFMREKDFAELWFPTWKTMLEQYASLGVRSSALCESDWMRYLDYLQELPAGTVLLFEYGDPKIIKEKLGKKLIISGLYPVGLLKTGTKQQVIDKAKELLDIMMPGGGYLFNFDKIPITMEDINLENLIALSEFLRDNMAYPNAGEPYGTLLNSENFKFDPTIMPKPESKYFFDWNEYKDQYSLTPDFARGDLEEVDKQVMDFFLNFLV